MANSNALKELLLGIAVENRYGVKISAGDSLRLKTLNDFIQFIEAEA